MQAQLHSAPDSLNSIGADDEWNAVLASDNGRVTEPSADLADESAGPLEIGDPSRRHHSGDDDIAVLEVRNGGAQIGGRNDAGASFDRALAGHACADNFAVVGP